MIKIHTLKEASFEEIWSCFQASFADYSPHFTVDKEYLQHKFRRDHINLELSAGAFDNEKLIGFILHGDGHYQEIYSLYNAASGVLPSYRGKHLTHQMYEFILPAVKREGILQIVLEVRDENETVTSVYQQIGFEQVREMSCFKGYFSPTKDSVLNHINLIDLVDWARLKNFWNWQPTWQNQPEAVIRTLDKQISLGYKKKDQLQGYIIYQPESGYISQYGVSPLHRQKGIGTALFSAVQQRVSANQIQIINVDRSDQNSKAFFEKNRIELFAIQKEMRLVL